MNMPRKGDRIFVVPYGEAVVERLLPNGAVSARINRLVPTSGARRAVSTIVVSQHVIWLPDGCSCAEFEWGVSNANG